MAKNSSVTEKFNTNSFVYENKKIDIRNNQYAKQIGKVLRQEFSFWHFILWLLDQGFCQDFFCGGGGKAKVGWYTRWFGGVTSVLAGRDLAASLSGMFFHSYKNTTFSSFFLCVHFRINHWFRWITYKTITEKCIQGHLKVLSVCLFWKKKSYENRLNLSET